MSGITNQQLEQAEAKLKRLVLPIAQDPANATWHWRRGVTLAAAADFLRAQEALETALSLLPRYADAWVSLGEIHAKMGRRNLAKRAFRSAVDIDPLTAGAVAGYRANSSSVEFFAWGMKTALQEYWRKVRRQAHCPGVDQVLLEASTLANSGHIAMAIDVLRRALDSCPGYLPLARVLGATFFIHGNMQQSRQLMKKMVAWWPKDPQAHYAYGVCLATIGDTPASVAALERALALNPKDNNIRIALAVVGKRRPPEANLTVTRRLFDSYAERFDNHLVDKLEYRVPEKLAAIFASSGRTWDRMLDLGCGTGLTGSSLRPYARHLTGVDLSRPMIEKAKARGVYDTLYQGDCVAFLQQSDAAYDLMVAADVLVYLGDLTELFRAAKQRLTPGGVFWFSVEDCGGDWFSIELSQRYQHSLSYIHTTAQAAGLRLIYEQQTDIRLDNGRPIRGRLVAIEQLPEFSEDSAWRFKPVATPG